MHQGIIPYFSILWLEKSEIIKTVATVSLLFYTKSLRTGGRGKGQKVVFQAEKKKSDPQIIQLGSLNTQSLQYQAEHSAGCIRNNFNISFRQNYPVLSSAELINGRSPRIRDAAYLTTEFRGCLSSDKDKLKKKKDKQNSLTEAISGSGNMLGCKHLAAEPLHLCVLLGPYFLANMPSFGCC